MLLFLAIALVSESRQRVSLFPPIGLMSVQTSIMTYALAFSLLRPTRLEDETAECTSPIIIGSRDATQTLPPAAA